MIIIVIIIIITIIISIMIIIMMMIIIILIIIVIVFIVISRIHTVKANSGFLYLYVNEPPANIHIWILCLFLWGKKSIVCTYSLCFIMNRHIVQSLIVICLLFMCSIHKWPQRLFSFITTYPYQDNKDYTCVYTVDIGFFSEEVLQQNSQR